MQTNPGVPPLSTNCAGDGQDERRFLGGYRFWTLELWSVLRLAAEFLRGFQKLHFLGPCVTVFGSARFSEDHRYYILAREAGRELARAGFATMTGGGPGIMEAANRGASEAGGLSVGCNIRLPQEQKPNPFLDKFVTVEQFYVRKVLLIKYSYGFIVMPGGFGTMDELFEVLTLVQTGKLSDFPMVLLPADFWRPLVDQVEAMLVGHGTVGEADLGLVQVMDSPGEAVDFIRQTAAQKYRLGYGRPRKWGFLGRLLRHRTTKGV